MPRPRQPRKTLRQTIADNQAQLIGLAKLHGKEPPVFSIIMPPASPRKPRVASSEPDEAAILKAILSYLRVDPNVALYGRFNSGAHYEGERYIQSNSIRGCADILGMTQGGQFFAIEVKSAKGRLSQHQDDFLAKVLSGGGLAGVARSVDDARRVLGEI